MASSIRSAPARRRRGLLLVDLLGGGLGEAPLDVGGDANLALAAGRRVDQLDEPDRRDVALARVVDRDRQQVVAQPESGERVDPLGAGEVGDHGDEPAPLAEAGDAVDGAGEVGAPEVLGRRRRGDRRRGWRAPGRGRCAAASP